MGSAKLLELNAQQLGEVRAWHPTVEPCTYSPVRRSSHVQGWQRALHKGVHKGQLGTSKQTTDLYAKKTAKNKKNSISSRPKCWPKFWSFFCSAFSFFVSPNPSWSEDYQGMIYFSCSFVSLSVCGLCQVLYSISAATSLTRWKLQAAYALQLLFPWLLQGTSGSF